MSSRFAVNLFFFINGFTYATWASRLPGLQDSYGMDNRSLGIILLAFSIGAFIAMPISGWLIVRRGSRQITQISGVLACLFFITIPWAPNLITLHIPFFLMGAFSGVLDVSMNAQAVEVEKCMKRPIMSFFHAVFSIGMVAGGLTSSILTKFEWTFFTHFTLMGGLSTATLLIASIYLFHDEPSETIEQERIIQWPKKVVLGLGLMAFCCMVGEGAMADWSANYLKRVMNATDARAALGLTAFASMMTIGRLLGDRAREKFGDKYLIRYCAVLSILGMAIILSKFHVILVMFGFGVVGLGLSIIVPIVYSLAGNLKNIAPGVGIAMATTIGYAGFMIGPPTIGFLADAFTLQIALGSIALLFIIMLTIALNLNIKD